ncbi:MAG: peptidylprolyl isomerase [Bdellovibrionales bacterium]
MKPEKSKLIKIAYKISDADGYVIENFPAEKPYEFIFGHGQILPVIEEALTDKALNESFQIAVGYEDAYGKYLDELVTEVPKDHFANEFSINVGMRFATKGPENEDVVVEVIEVRDSTVILDGNHPLAGLDLIFDIELIAVLEAPTELIEELKSEDDKSVLH